MQRTTDTDLFLAEQTDIPREYLRRLRMGRPVPTRNVGTRSSPGSRRKTAKDDERWAKLAQIAFPESEHEQRRFIGAIVALQTGKEEEPEATESAWVAGPDTEGFIVRLHPDFKGTIEVAWEGRTYRLTRVS